jgi:hypothetical protein
MTPLLRRWGFALLERSLKRTFRRIEWVGALAVPPVDRPVVLYANHHAFRDSYALGWFIQRVLNRRGVVWMEELDRFPFFGVMGPLPFPADDPLRRAMTVRRTSRLMATDPRTVLLYYPEAVLHPADDGVLPFPADRFLRLQRVFPPAQWWPVALRVTGWHDARPSVLLTGGPVRNHASGTERESLERLLERLRDPGRAPRTTLLEGREGPHERWDFSGTRRFFSPRSIR